MARWYLGMKNEAREDKTIGGVIGGGMERGQDIDRPNVVLIPPLFGGGSVPLKKGGVAFGLVGKGFYHVGPGEYVDIPDDVPPRSVRLMAPQLLNKDQAMEAGICNEDGSLIRADKAPKPRGV